MKDILFSYLKISACPTKQIVQALEKIPKHYWFYDPYRTVEMLPIFTDNGNIDRKGSLNTGRNKAWTLKAPKKLKDYLTKNIFYWMKPPGRVMILRTLPGKRNNLHIDCRPENFLFPQYKLRIVLQGDVSSLFFLTNTNQIYPEYSIKGVPFIIDGRWPHGMKNKSNKIKYTVCIGTPWTGAGLYDGLIDKKTSIYYWKDYTLPTHYKSFFEKDADRKKKLS